MLRLEIGGRWEPQDFISILRSVESFYYKFADEQFDRFRGPYWLDYHYLIERERFGSPDYRALLDRLNERMVESALYKTPSHLRLSVRKIQYASPGGIDLLGIGKIFEVISTSIGRIKLYFDEAHLRSQRDAQASLDTELKRIEVERARESLQSLKIKNAQEALELFDSHPDMHEMLLPLLVRDQDTISHKIADRKLLSARTIPGTQEQD
jgi:hypothetical protein